MVPVFIEGVHRFTVCVLAHQADIGNSLPSTYMPTARDVYNEGALIFTATQVQRDYRDIDDIIRMCRRRIRVPDQWYGDYLAQVGAARLAERRLKEVCGKYGVESVLHHLSWWTDYGETMMADAIRRLPAGVVTEEVWHDPIDGVLPDGFRVRVKLEVDPAEAMIRVDLTDNGDCLDCGLNLTETTSRIGAVQGVLNCIPERVPINEGSFRRIEITMRDGAAIGRPAFPHSTSVATTNLLCRLSIAVHGAFAKLGDGHGLAQSGLGMSAGWGVIAGKDRRYGGTPYVNQLFTGFAGGPAAPRVDGWVNSGSTGGHAMLLRDSVEVLETKYPIQVDAVRMLPGSGGAGRFRGAPGEEVVFGPRFDAMDLAVMADGQVHPPAGVHGGEAGVAGATFLVEPDGTESRLPGVVQTVLEAGQRVRAIDNGGGGYGPPHERDPRRVLRDVREGYETVQRARDVYGVVLTGTVDDDTLAVDDEATRALREGGRAGA
ncbi:hydantoinase B/oxoprolinase family protein [Capillimicrobium parvum]|uniref:Acetophenone carboxylase delta subunit n=1 Tax=Capillimicrobium parvum TaxID=2884022 RepID=A0A9E6Y2X2_9ACTN|nr:Acetophenone carboxylase delta subunit [Capillimicrobium parvum]